RGRNWDYVRGLDWVAKVKGRYGGPPKEWNDSTRETASWTLPEDYVNCLSEMRDGSLWTGHRQAGAARVDVSIKRTTPHLASPRRYVTSFLVSESPIPSMGTYGDGQLLTSLPRPGDNKAVANAQLPSAAKPA